MEEFKIKVKDAKNFVKTERVLAASDSEKEFYIALRAGPNVKRYIVINRAGPEVTENGFTKIGEAVKYFNSIREKKDENKRLKFNV